MYKNGSKSRKGFKSPVIASTVKPLHLISKSSGRSLNVEDLKAELEQLKVKEKGLDEELAKYDGPPPETVLSDFIQQLQKYNKNKDAAQKLMGVVAEMDEVSVREVSKRYGAPDE